MKADVVKVLVWSWLVLLTVLSRTGEVESAARFLSRVPHDDYDDGPHDDPLRHDASRRRLPEFDSDIKIPGRHYPKLPYNDHFPVDPYDEEADEFTDSSSSSFLNPNTHRHHHRQHTSSSSSFGNPYHSHNSAGHSDNDQHSMSSYDGTLNSEPSYSEYGDYTDSSDSSKWRQDEKVESSPQHRLSLQSDRADPPPKSGHPSLPTDFTEMPSTGPRFDRTTPRTVVVEEGKNALLICRVLNIGDKSVSWMRHEDLHILTVDKYKYSTDERLSVLYNEGDQEWLLKIQGVTPEDAGMYECQVSTKPVLSFIVNVEVVDSLPTTTPFPKLRDAEKIAHDPKDEKKGEKKVPSATILNGPQIHVHRGSLINLTCIVDHTSERPLYVLWDHENKEVDYVSQPGVSVLTKTGRNTVSQLLVENARQSHSGKYTCKPSNGESATVFLHVHNGERPAAMQTNEGSRNREALSPSHLLTLISTVHALSLLLLMLPHVTSPGAT